MCPILKKYIIFIVAALIALSNIIILDVIEVKMCKSFSIYRFFTMNSTVCTNISKAVGILEKLLTTLVIALCSTLFQNAMGRLSEPHPALQILQKNDDGLVQTSKISLDNID